MNDAGGVSLEDQIVEFTQRRTFAFANATLEDLGHGFRGGELGENPGLKLVDVEIGLGGHAFQGDCAADILSAEKSGIALEVFRREEEIGVLVHARKIRLDAAYGSGSLTVKGDEMTGTVYGIMQASVNVKRQR